MKKFNGSLRKQVGATLLELTMVVGIISIIAIAAISYYNTTSHSNKINDEVKNVNTLTAAVRNMFDTQGSYTGLTNAVILKSGAFPDRMRVPNSTTLIQNAWVSNGVDLKTVAYQGTTDAAFTVTYKMIPERACTDIVAKTFRHYQDVTPVTVNGTAVLNSGVAATSCNTATNTIVFTAR
jgi:type II secretory pathway pseudopilin PulG